MDSLLFLKKDITKANEVEPVATRHQEIIGEVTPNYVHPQTLDTNSKSILTQWFLMRVSYGREAIVARYLQNKTGIDDILCPQCQSIKVIKGKQRLVNASLLPNLLLVKSTVEVLKTYIGSEPIPYFHHYYQSDLDRNGNVIGNGKRPITIPDRQIESFKTWINATEYDKIFLNHSITIKKNDFVRITEGVFAGFTGYVIRIKGQSRVGVNIEGVGFISTTYIPKYCLEKIN